ncbi:hypothetical protein [Streptomyces sp. NBC_01304]|uniref:hypothetical protein n=1 Tax=Streptomyces sp. NBC_01304 TaxID=2903818 RepID=UPI002E1517FB|nr:hypothetical protein OG430_47575 [Streptomyces sp. NBC_01304]
MWAVAATPAQRFLEQARSARSEEDIDALYVEVQRYLGHEAGALPHPQELRALFNSPAATSPPRGPGGSEAVVHLVAAAGLGVEELGENVLAEVLTALGLGPAATRAALADHRRQEALLARVGPAATRHDPLARVKEAGEQQLAQARHVMYQLAGVGALYWMHALLMPDTPTLAELRNEIDELGVHQILHQALIATMEPQGVAHVLPACLDEGVADFAADLHERLLERGERLLVLPGHEQDHEAFSRAWLAELQHRAQTDQ